MTKTYKARNPKKAFRSKWELDPTTGCHLWKRPSNSPQAFVYPSFTPKKGVPDIPAAHFALISSGEPKPEAPGTICCHHCDNVRCVNPDHLYWGTKKDNARDASDRNRGIGRPKGYRHSPETIAKMRASRWGPF